MKNLYVNFERSHERFVVDFREPNPQLDNADQDILDSLDKYKHLEETPFKQNFLEILSQNIQVKLEKATRFNQVFLQPRKFILNFLVHKIMANLNFSVCRGTALWMGNCTGRLCRSNKISDTVT